MKPAAAFAAPIASSSCEARTFWRCFPANARAVRISSAKETTKMPSAAGTSRTTSRMRGVGTVTLGSPTGSSRRPRRRGSLGRAPTKPQSTATTTISAAGSLGRKKRSTNSAASATTLTTTVVAAHVAELVDHLPQLTERLAGVDRKPEQLAELADDQHHGDAMDVADEHWAGEVVGDPAEPQRPRDQEAGRDEQRERRRQLGRQRRCPRRPVGGRPPRRASRPTPPGRRSAGATSQGARRRPSAASSA